jgi:hypothetical protein
MILESKIIVIDSKSLEQDAQTGFLLIPLPVTAIAAKFPLPTRR